MSLSIGIVGLPNVGKSTVFNALSGAQIAQVANYPFCTIKPNRAIVPLPDPRLEKLAALVKVANTIHATLEFVDIAGLVKGASQGEGLGNQFLGNIRDTAAILHVVRCFDDPNVVHVSPNLDPRADIEIINLELILADLQQLERKIERLNSQVKGDKQVIPMLALAQALVGYLQTGKPISSYPEQENENFKALNHEMRFITGKPVIYVANVDETGLAGENEYVQAVREISAEQGAEMVLFCAKLEEEMQEMSAEEQREFLQLAGAEESGLEQVIRKSFETLGLISFFTKNENEVRAWNVVGGSTAPKAAGVIHTDFERGFIRAEVVAYDTFVRCGSDAAVRAEGLLRLEGKDYVVQDGDVIFFRFNV
ncbi:MAG: redox-regulated ATPase YchF [Anaerolineales bacterium]|nr:MAG: redox-regulated ATPase YchF [Anaerolineales bacterium]